MTDDELYVVPGMAGPEYDRLAVRRRGMPTPEEIEVEERELYAEYVDVAGAVLSFEDWRAMRSEAAYERSLGDYYGGNAPATDTERTRLAWEDHKETHR